MGLPEIYISFETAAGSAVYRSLSEVDESKFTAANYRLLKLCFLAAPSKVAVLRLGNDEADTFTALDTLDFDYLAGPGLTRRRSSATSRPSAPRAAA